MTSEALMARPWTRAQMELPHHAWKTAKARVENRPGAVDVFV